MRFRGVAKIRLEGAGTRQVRSIVEAFPNADYDYPRREVTDVAVVEAEDETSARGKLLGRMNQTLSDAGLSWADYSVECHVMRL
jgi:hypothetical protein